jgi:dipeptidyl aminopeptidase B
MAVAPVTDWRFYNSEYTETYMLTPKENPTGYNITAVTNTTALSDAKRFFLAHGTGDDNVLIEHSMVLIDKLIVNGVMNWDSQFFPDDDHDIDFHGAYPVVYRRLAEWLQRYFGTKEGTNWRTGG